MFWMPGVYIAIGICASGKADAGYLFHNTEMRQQE